VILFVIIWAKLAFLNIETFTANIQSEILNILDITIVQTALEGKTDLVYSIAKKRPQYFSPKGKI
jgi:hypothetical protein